jgi:ribosome-binding protein aMBF1 (putative translation factor)
MTKKEFKQKTKNMTTFDSVHRKWMKNPEFRKAYLALKPEYDLIRDSIRRRIKKEMTQKQLAEKLGTKQSAISRFEKGKGNPTVSFLKDVTEALGGTLKISVK